MKLVGLAIVDKYQTSPPTRGRGLKRGAGVPSDADIQVAPHAGAWIETLRLSKRWHYCHVAPHAGAWIETLFLPWQGRGRDVAPHAGAWIETD